MSPIDAESKQARDRWCAWMRWYMTTFGVGQNELARRLYIKPASLSLLLQPGSQRSPAMSTLVASKRLTGYAIDALLFSDPPALPTKR